MSTFALYFVERVLREAGWPRGLGLFRGKGYDAAVVDAALAESIDWASGLGAARPALSLQMIAEMFRDEDWEGKHAPDLRALVEGNSESSWGRAMSPREAVQPPRFVEFGTTVGLEELQHPEFRTGAERLLFMALLWGMSYPDRFEAWYRTEAAFHVRIVLLASKPGVLMRQLPRMREFVESGEQIVHQYARDVGPLSAIPEQLRSDADVLGWCV
jgi:hypothetical protein